MIKKILLLFFFICISISISYSQHLSIVTGNVIDSESKLPISNAAIEIYKENKLIHRAVTDTLGNFTISLNSLKTSDFFKISIPSYSSLNISNKSIDLNSLIKNDGFLGVFKLLRTSILLKEVIIKSRKRYRDTAIIDLSKETFMRSIMIDDIFSQKGLYKTGDGQLYYNGKIVSDIVVNGNDFFGKNNLKIYDKIPALILKNIEVIETNIDSITNTTLLVPTIKINLNIKDNHLKGTFGSISTSIGTKQRYIFNSDLYTYRNQQQISLTTGLNNIGLNEFLGEPAIGLSTAGNNSSNKYAKFTYRNMLGNKIEVNFLTNIKAENRLFLSESERTEESIHQFSKTRNSLLSKSFQLENLGLNIHYKIDSLNLIKLNSVLQYDNIKNLDSLDYYIKTDISKINSFINRSRSYNNHSFLNTLLYEKKFHKKGRSFQAEIDLEGIKYNINEISNVLNESDKYSVLGNRNVSHSKSIASAYFTEPYGYQTYIKINTSYKRERISYFSSTTVDIPETGLKDRNELINTYIQSGFTFQKIKEKLSISGTLNAIINKREIQAPSKNIPSLLNIDFNIKLDSRINAKKSISWSYAVRPNYPNINQLTSLNNSFDLVSQMKGNINLRPEIKHTLGFIFDFKKSDSLNLLVSTEADYYFSKFGVNLNSIPGEIQSIFTDNVGESKSASITFLASKVYPHIGSFSYRLGLNYNELPTIINIKRDLTSGITVTQSLSTNRTIINNIFIISPLISLSYNKYFYNNNTQTSTYLTYSDKLGVTLSGFEMNIYPFVNITKGISNQNLTYAVNSEVRKKVFNNYGLIWIKAYDIFNSFRFQYNAFGPTYTESIRYSNFSRYLLLGLTIKFNNIK